MKQLTVIGHRRPRLLADVSAALAGAGINIETIDAEAISDLGILILTVDRYDDALKTLHRLEDIEAISEDVILIRIEDRPGALAEIARRFADAGIDLRSLRILDREGDRSIVAVCTERSERALDVVADILIS